MINIQNIQGTQKLNMKPNKPIENGQMISINTLQNKRYK
jgi:hypothetical protein